MANASKVGFESVGIAMLHLSFTNAYPYTIFRASLLGENTCTNGRDFVSAFSSAKIFEGDMTDSMLKEKLRILEQNHDIGLLFKDDN